MRIEWLCDACAATELEARCVNQIEMLYEADRWERVAWHGTCDRCLGVADWMVPDVAERPTEW